MTLFVTATFRATFPDTCPATLPAHTHACNFSRHFSRTRARDTFSRAVFQNTTRVFFFFLKLCLLAFVSSRGHTVVDLGSGAGFDCILAAQRVGRRHASLPKAPHPKVPDPKAPHPKVPHPKVPHPKVPDPKVPYPKVPHPNVLSCLPYTPHATVKHDRIHCLIQNE